MNRVLRALLVCVVASVGLFAPIRPVVAQAVFTVTIDPPTGREPVSGRLVVYVTRRDNPRLGAREPGDGPFFESPSPMYSLEVKDAAPGAKFTFSDSTPGMVSFPAPPGTLGAGPYLVQAVLHQHSTDSRWKREPGTLFSQTIDFVIPEDATGATTIGVTLAQRVAPELWPKDENVDLFEMRSEILSAALGREVILRAGVVPPLDYRPGDGKTYPAVYDVPGFGGTARDAIGAADRLREVKPEEPLGALGRQAFWIVLDPESGNGHTLFVDSENNGPRGRALVEELIPALEKKYPLVATPMARIITGHSSGGWSSIWLAITYPQTFGACFSSSPDPVDFRKFQLVNIYADKSMYSGLSGDIPSYRDALGVTRMTIRQENLMEEVLGPANTAGQQWDSWQAVFGPRSPGGTPAALFDPKTGAIDPRVAEQYKKYDIRLRLAADPKTLAPIFKQRVRIVVGDADNFYLNEAVALLKAELAGIETADLPEGEHGSIAIVAGKDHGSIFQTPERRAFPREMLEHFRRHNLVPKP